MTERLAVRYEDAAITAIDVSPGVGRLFRGAFPRVSFAQRRVEDVVAETPGAFDLAILSDVLHHVPLAARASLLGALRASVAPGGTIVFKDWARTHTPIHLLCAASDRFLTGDDVAYLSEPELQQTAEAAFGKSAVCHKTYVTPWRNNVGFLVRPEG